MAQHRRLTAIALPKLGPGLHADGDGLYFRVTLPNANGTSARGWVLRYQQHGRRRHHGLGGFPKVSLQEARQEATRARQTLSRGEDPIHARQQAKALSRARSASARSFDQSAEAYLAAQQAGWRNAKHR